jgi:hypothetical protein
MRRFRGAVELTSYACWTPAQRAGGLRQHRHQWRRHSNQLVGGGYPDLCSGKGAGVTYIAEITGVLALGGPNVIGGACDKALGSDPAAFGEGITLLTVFRDNGKPARVVDVWVGYTSTTSSGTGNAPAHRIFRIPTSRVGAFSSRTRSTCHFNFGDQFFINGTSVGTRSMEPPARTTPGSVWPGRWPPTICTTPPTTTSRRG